MTADLKALHFKKSTRSNGSSQCVEVASAPGVVAVRDTKDRTGPILAFDRESWAGFVAGLK